MLKLYMNITFNVIVAGFISVTFFLSHVYKYSTLSLIITNIHRYESCL